MKKIAIILLAVFTLSGYAQQEKMSNALKERLIKNGDASPKYRAALETKQMTLKLDLTKDQQIKVEQELTAHYTSLSKKMKTDKKARNEMTDTERRAQKMNRLDSKIDKKEKMKSILDEKQYAKYSEMMDNKKQRKPRKAKKQ